MTAVPWIVLGLALVWVAWVNIRPRWLERTRSARIARWAAEHRFAFARTGVRQLGAAWGLPMADPRPGCKVTHVLRRPDALCFTFRHDHENRVPMYGVYALALPTPLPGNVYVRQTPDPAWDNDAAGYHHVRFESEDFNRAYRVLTDDRRLASDVVHPLLMQWLLDGRRPGFRLCGRWAVLVRPGGLDTDAVEPSLRHLADVRDAVPRFVWDAH